jgi:high affinity Mn2+ porin
MTSRGLLLFIALAAFAAPGVAFAQTTPTPMASAAVTVSPTPLPAPQRYSFHIQATNTQMYNGNFAAAYSGAQSLYNYAQTAKTFDTTLFLGMRLWKGGELYFNPEIDQGFGLGNPGLPGEPYNGTFGVAGFVSGEAYKVGAQEPYTRVQRLFVRQTFDLGGEPQAVDADINQLRGATAPKHLTLTAGLYSVVDIFDNNVYAHDPRNDFLNWSIIDMGSFDYAADSWGYTYGITGELVNAASAFRLGVFQLSKEPNQIAIEQRPFYQWSPVVEYERDTSFFGGHPGAIKALFYGNYGFMGTYADAIALGQATGTAPNTADVRYARHWKLGGGINIAQEVAPHIGVFARYSGMNGVYEAFDFTDINRSLSGGISIDGGLYHRPNDTIGLAMAFNSIDSPAKQFFADGGLGILVGDGGLSYGGEHILETYYKLGVTQYGAITADYQYIVNPGYNTVRGPASVYGLRYHVQI